MKTSIILTSAIALIFGNYAVEPKKTSSQPYPKNGFWVTESVPGVPYTTVKYYANCITLILEEKVLGEVDITRRSARKNLNASLKKELGKDSNVNFRKLNLYQVNGEAER